MLTIAHTAADAKLAARIRGDLEAAEYTIHDSVQPGKDALLIVVLSPNTAADEGVQRAIIDALHNYQHVIPVIAQQVALPKLIDHLQPIDFSDEYDVARLLHRIEEVTAPGAPPPLTTLTPNVRASNLRAGLIGGGIVLILFVLGVYLIAFEGLAPPSDDFAAVETEIILTRNYFIDEALPRSTEDAETFPLTLEAAREAVQDPLELTVTGISEGAHFGFLPEDDDQAANFEITLDAISTVVRPDVIATATAATGED